jgi:hypothetical protein
VASATPAAERTETMTTATKTATIRLVHTPSSTRAIVVAENGRVVGETEAVARGHVTAATIRGIELAESLGYSPDVTREDVRAATAGATVEATIAAARTRQATPAVPVMRGRVR